MKNKSKSGRTYHHSLSPNSVETRSSSLPDEQLEDEVLEMNQAVKLKGRILTLPIIFLILGALMINSSGDFEMGDLEADTRSVKIDSSGDITLGVLNADTLEVDIDSSGNLDIAGGQVETQNITIDSSGSYTAQDLESAETEVRLNSSGSATIWVQDYLKANLSSSGDLSYRGSPSVDATTTGSGEVTQIGE